LHSSRRRGADGYGVRELRVTEGFDRLATGGTVPDLNSAGNRGENDRTCDDFRSLNPGVTAISVAKPCRGTDAWAKLNLEAYRLSRHSFP
jgi:hypothetical protein